METFSAWLALCAGNSPVTGEFPSQRPVTRSFAVLFDLSLNKRLRKNRDAGDLRPLWRHCNSKENRWYNTGMFRTHCHYYWHWPVEQHRNCCRSFYSLSHNFAKQSYSVIVGKCQTKLCKCYLTLPFDHLIYPKFPFATVPSTKTVLLLNIMLLQSRFHGTTRYVYSIGHLMMATQQKEKFMYGYHQGVFRVACNNINFKPNLHSNVGRPKINYQMQAIYMVIVG